MKSIRHREIFALAIGLLYSFIGLCLSFYYEYIAQQKPCQLCLWQRFLLGGVFFCGLVGMLSSYRFFFKFVMIFCLLGFFSLAAFHFLIHMGLMSDLCAVPTQIKNYDQFMKMLNSPKSCAASSIRFFGIPLVGLNVLSSFILLCAFFSCRR